MLILLASLAAAGSAQSPKWNGTWSATAGSRVFSGTWEAAESSDAATASGNWTLTDRSGTPLAAGTWAAGRSAKAWQGSWQARAVNGQTYSGTWRAQVQLAATAPMAEMFQAALASAIQGTWHMGAPAGAWSIRAYSR